MAKTPADYSKPFCQRSTINSARISFGLVAYLFAQVFNIAEDMHHERRRLAHEQDESASKSSFAHVIDELKAQRD